MTIKPLLLVLFFMSFQYISQGQCVSGDCQNGKGIYIYPSGAKYIGQFQGGEIHGIGTCYYTDGSIYRGEWTNRYPNGRGIKTYADGNKRDGQWEKGQPVDENGNLIESLVSSDEKSSDGTDIQSGCIKGDCKNGEGTFAYPNGSKYVGQFSNGKIEGWGTWYYIDGSKYIGAFQNGFQHGNGSIYHTDDTETTGEWKEGEYVGNSYIEEGKEGCISGNCENGTGTYIFKEGIAKYIGTFKNRLPEGEGVVYYSNGERYVGLWENGSFNGEGTLFMKDGTEVAGDWQDGVFQGVKEEIEEEVAAIEQENETETSETSEPEKTSTLDDIRVSQEKAQLKVWAVVVGVASYDHMPTLRYTDDDAYRIYAFLKSPEGGALPDEQIRILIDEDATREKIQNTMTELYAQASENDLIILYFSGHGLKGSFLPIDFDGYNNKLLHEEVNEIFDNSNAKYKLCIADACHSGSLLAMKSGAVQNTLINYYKTLAEAQAGTALIMSSKSNETSLESSGLRQGVFSHFLIRGLKGEADTNTNKVVSIQELFNYIDENVRTYTGNRQSPVIQGDYDEEMTVSVLR